MVGSGRFEGRTAVITGGASGAGRGVAQRITREGGKVALWDLNPQTLAEVRAAIPLAHTIALDISDADAVAKAARDSFDALGGIDILVNSAGITGATTPVQDFPIDSWKRVFAINVDGVFYSCRAIVPLMLKADYGRIVNISSVAGKEGNPNASAYSASKAAVLGFTKSLGKELATTGIRVNAITPAAFKTPILEQMPQSFRDYMQSKIPMGRLGEVEEVAALICWLASEECSFSTAATFDISGGRTTY